MGASPFNPVEIRGEQPNPRAAALLTKARETTGFFPEDEAMALYRVARRAASTGLGPIVEIGAYRGRSTLFLAAGIADATSSWEPTVCFSVDHHHGSQEMQAGSTFHDETLIDPSTGLMDSLPAWRQNIAAAKAEDLVIAVIGDAERIASVWAQSLCLVLIDGGHGKNVCWADYRGWAPHVSVGGFLAFHDVFEDERLGGRPPFECYLDALSSGAFVEDSTFCLGSLKVLMRCSKGR